MDANKNGAGGKRRENNTETTGRCKARDRKDVKSCERRERELSLSLLSATGPSDRRTGGKLRKHCFMVIASLTSPHLTSERPPPTPPTPSTLPSTLPPAPFPPRPAFPLRPHLRRRGDRLRLATTVQNFTYLRADGSALLAARRQPERAPVRLT